MTLKDLWLLDSEIAYLNHGSFGACPRAVLEEQNRLRKIMEENPVSFLWKEFRERLDEARQRLATFLNAHSEGLVFLTNATMGVNAVLRSSDLKPHDEILVTNHGYGACNNAAGFVADQRGATVTTVKLPFPLHDEKQIIESILDGVNSRTRLAIIDHITSPTACVLPVKKLVNELNLRGVKVLVDGAHAPGMLRLDLPEIGAQYYTGNCHKWMCAPKGAAFLYVQEEERDCIFPPVISHGITWPTESHSRYHNMFDWTGTFDPTAVFTIPCAIDTLASFTEGGWDVIQRDNQKKAREAGDLITSGLSLEKPLPDSLIGSMVSILFPGPVGEFEQTDDLIQPLQTFLFKEHKIEVPVFPWDDGSMIIRISAHLYNEMDEYEKLFDVLKRLF